MITALRERWVGADTSDGASSTRRRWWLDPGIVAPVAAAALYLVAVGVRLPAVFSSYYWYSDFPEALRLGDAVFHGGWGQGLAVPSQSGLGPLWVVGLFQQTTGSDVPGMALGAVIVLVAAAFMVSTARRILGTRGAIAVGALCIAAPPVVGWELITPIAHETTLLLTAAAAWQLVTLSREDGLRRLAPALGLGALAGVCIVSDPLAVATAAIPWGICAVLVARRRPHRRRALLVSASCALASGMLLSLLASVSGIVERSNTLLMPSMQGITAGLRTTATTLGQMFTGAWYGYSFPDVIAVSALVLFLAVLYMATRTVTQRARDVAPGRDVYVWFWVLSSGGLIAAFCVSGLGIQYDPVSYQGHYVDGLWFAIAALLPVALVQARVVRAIALACVTALVLSAAAGVMRAPAYPFQDPDYVDGPQLTATLQQLGVTHGYGGYWESYAIGWHTDQHIQALPLQRCTDASGVHGLCRYEFAASAWYRTQPGPVFVVALTVSCRRNDLCINVSDLDDLPKPIAVRTVGLLQVDVYSSDVLAGLPMATSP